MQPDWSEIFDVYLHKTWVLLIVHIKKKIDWLDYIDAQAQPQCSYVHSYR